MKALIEASVRQPITVAVGVILAILAGAVAFSRVPVQLAPEVTSTVVAVETIWPNATPSEIEADIIEQQEDALSDITNLQSIISTASLGRAELRLEFRTGTDIDTAVAQVDQKLAQVPFYPDGVSNPEIDGRDPESIDYIAWVGFSCTDPDFPAATLGDFMDRQLRPRFERIPGISEAGIRGTRDREVIITVDAAALAARGITWGQLLTSLEANNRNASGGALSDGKRDIRLLTRGRFNDPEQVEALVLRRDQQGTIRLGDVADVRLGYSEASTFVRIRGVSMPVFNFQLAKGANLIETMTQLQAEFAALNAPGGLLERQAQIWDIDGELQLVQVYDAALYVKEAIDMVQSNILIGSVLAIIVLLLFLRSVSAVGIIGIAIPISVIAAIPILAGLGRTVNLISLAGFAFAVGMVVDNAIVVIENIYRHLELGKKRIRAAFDGAQEVAGAVLASTLTTLIVFLPVLFIQEVAGQLFRDIALAIMAAVGLSLIVSLTVIPAASALFLRRPQASTPPATQEAETPFHTSSGLAAWLAKLIPRLSARWWLRWPIIALFAIGTITGISLLVPPLDYLPKGNRNLAFGLVLAPPGYALDQMNTVADRIQERIRPYWELTADKFKSEPHFRERRSQEAKLAEASPKPIPTMTGETVAALPIEHYFMGSFGGLLFHGAVASDQNRAVDIAPLLQWASDDQAAPDMFGFAFQPPIIRTAGSSGSAIRIDFSGSDLDLVTAAGRMAFFRLMRQYGPGAARPTPSNFLSTTPQVRIEPNDIRLQEAGLSRTELGLALQAAGDGIRLIKRFEDQAVLRDLTIISSQSAPAPAGAARPESFDSAAALRWLDQLPIATASGHITDLGSLATIRYERVADEIQRVNRERSVTIELTPPPEVPLETAIAGVKEMVADMRTQGLIDPSVGVKQSGSAGALNAIKTVLLGDGGWWSTITSAVFLSLLVVYLMMVVLFQSWVQPLVIMVSVPLATVGGFLGIAALHSYSVSDRYTPVVNMDVLTILGFVILAGVVVNNAILIVSQSLSFLRQQPEQDIARIVGQATASRVRPIAMSMCTSIGGMLPLVLFPGSGTELYRGLAAVLVGGLALSTLFTLILIPLLLVAVLQWFPPGPRARGQGPSSGADQASDAEAKTSDTQQQPEDPPPPPTATPPDTSAPALGQGPGTQSKPSGPKQTPPGIALFFIGVSLLGLTACQVGPTYRKAPPTAAGQAPIDLPAETPFAYAESAEQLNAELADWWTRFDDAVLNELIILGTRQNQQLAAAVARLATAQARYRTISGEQWPELEALAAAGRQRQSGELGQGPARTDTRLTVGLALTWEIDLWGRLQRQTAAAGAATRVSRADLDQVAISLRASIASTYLRLRELQARLQSAQENVKVLDESLDLARVRVKAGLAPQQDEAQALGIRHEVAAAIPSLQRLLAESRTELAVLLGGTEANLPTTLSQYKELPQPPAKVSIAVPADLLRRRPDIRAAEQRLQEQTERIGVATADLYPTLTLNGTFGWAASSAGALFTNPAAAWSISPDLGTVLFNRDKLYAQIDVEEHRLQEAVADYQQSVLQAIQEVQDALRAYRFEDQRRSRLQDAREAQSKAVELAKTAYRRGLSQYQPVLDAQRQLVLIEDRLWQATAARAQAIVATYRALGGTWGHSAVNRRLQELRDAPVSTSGTPAVQTESD